MKSKFFTLVVALTILMVGNAVQAEDGGRVPPAPPTRNQNAPDTSRDQNRGDQISESKKRVQDARQSFLGLKKPLNDDQKANALAKAKEFALALVAKIENHSESLKEHINNSDMQAARKEKLLGELDAGLNKLTALKAQIDAATTLAEVRSLVKDLRQGVNHARFLYRRQLGLLVSHQLRNGVEHMATALNKIEQALSALANRGVSTSAAEATLVDIKSRLANLRASAQNTESAYDLLNEDDNYDHSADSADGVTARVKTELKQIMTSVKELLATVKSLTAANEGDEAADSL